MEKEEDVALMPSVWRSVRSVPHPFPERQP